ncbi:MAG: bifunctional precorrin-2 dehydrogenase/sirohydrochlorin ferrochelatase [Saprospiraceae bacterium]|nr:bifunctional precorrin-2 dehydrogenase/sirohydrochlorin ferrochelatase [Saprospiraceae bacterium]
MKLYPISLKLDAVPCIVVGGGTVALRKVQSLLESAACVTLVSPRLCPKLGMLYKKKAFRYVRSVYREKFLKGMFLVIAATDRPGVNEQVARDAALRRLLVNVVDYPDWCNFYVPALIRKNGVLISISTQGAFPGLAKKIRQECMAVVGGYSGNLKRIVALRNQIKQECGNKRERKKMIERLLSPSVMALIGQKKIRTFSDLKKHRGVL